MVAESHPSSTNVNASLPAWERVKVQNAELRNQVHRRIVYPKALFLCTLTIESSKPVSNTEPIHDTTVCTTGAHMHLQPVAPQFP